MRPRHHGQTQLLVVPKEWEKLYLHLATLAAQSAAALKMPLRHLCRSAYLAASDKDDEKTLVSDLSKMRQKKTLFSDKISERRLKNWHCMKFVKMR